MGNAARWWEHRFGRVLVVIGACATSGGIQALRNFADVTEFRSLIYASPERIDTLATSTPISAHVPVNYELRGCPIDRRQLLEVLSAFLVGRKPDLPDTSVCTECKRRGLTCVIVAEGTPCLGPVTHAGCGALCPALPARLLRLLRPDDRAEYASADRAAAGLRLERGRDRARVSHVQRHRARLHRRDRGL
jgi:hypothetical protein